MKRLTPRHGMDRRSAVLETLVVITVVTIIVVVAVPAYAARAKESVLQQNAQSLAEEVRGNVALGLDGAFVAEGGPAGAGSALTSLSTNLAGALRNGDAGRYVNPLSGSATVVCETALPSGADGNAPAVWITDAQDYAYAAFSASTTTSCLRGTLVVVFMSRDGRTSCVDVFYVDAGGKRSSAATVVGIGA